MDSNYESMQYCSNGFYVSNLQSSQYVFGQNNHAPSDTVTKRLSLPNMAQLGWALLFLLGSWSSVKEGPPLPRIASLPRNTLPSEAPLPGAEVADLLHGSPPSEKDALHSGPLTNIHQRSSGFTRMTGKSRLQERKRGKLSGQKGKIPHKLETGIQITDSVEDSHFLGLSTSESRSGEGKRSMKDCRFQKKKETWDNWVSHRGE